MAASLRRARIGAPITSSQDPQVLLLIYELYSACPMTGGLWPVLNSCGTLLSVKAVAAATTKSFFGFVERSRLRSPY